VATTPAYFGVLGLTLLEGRLLEDRDALTENLESIVVDRAWARRFFPNEGAVGKRLREGGCTTCPWTRVVGVVSEALTLALTSPMTARSIGRCPSQGLRGLSWFARTWLHRRCSPTCSGSCANSTVRAAVQHRDHGRSVAESLEGRQSLSLLVATFALVALVLSVVGIYGVTGYYVQQHSGTSASAWRVGGSSADVLRLGRPGMRVVVIGVFVGVPLRSASHD
jgi:hypothetical protein